jgi:CBS domain containing-hemolysin-like protein
VSATIPVLLGAAAAFLCALADAAMLAAESDENAVEVAAHTNAHRALAFARVLAQLLTGASVARALLLHERSTLAAVGLALLASAVAVIVTESAAREIGDALGARAARGLAPIVRVAEIVLAPVLLLNARLDEALMRALPPAPADESSREETAEQFREVITSEADVTPQEQSLLAGVFSLGETVVHEIMVPRVDMVGVERETPWSEVLDRVRSSEHSRLPVYDETLDEILGILYAKDLLPDVIAGQEPAAGWTSLVRAALFIPPTKRVDAQLRDFRASGTHIAIVVDEYGGTAGLITIEDVLEEIVGDIRDEYDVDDERPIECEGTNRFWVSGRVTLDELSDVTGHPFEHEDVSTVGGLVYELLGRVPRAGEQLAVDGFRVIVERVVRRKIQRVYLERLEPEPAAQPAAGEAGEEGAG